MGLFQKQRSNREHSAETRNEVGRYRPIRQRLCASHGCQWQLRNIPTFTCFRRYHWPTKHKITQLQRSLYQPSNHPIDRFTRRDQSMLHLQEHALEKTLVSLLQELRVWKLPSQELGLRTQRLRWAWDLGHSLQPMLRSLGEKRDWTARSDRCLWVRSHLPKNRRNW